VADDPLEGNRRHKLAVCAMHQNPVSDIKKALFDYGDHPLWDTSFRRYFLFGVSVG
jgi:hypothetical protein